MSPQSLTGSRRPDRKFKKELKSNSIYSGFKNILVVANGIMNFVIFIVNRMNKIAFSEMTVLLLIQPFSTQITASYRTMYELSDFPFDSQVLEMELFSRHDIGTEWNFLIDDENSDAFEQFVETLEWNVVPGSWRTSVEYNNAGAKVYLIK